uniref:Haloacid dehalogenase-like hydrolase n=1 Tax=Chromera velia CCMP2878 TaxID=1169474 RepID=A0A0G4HIU5_9ALVE|eukprot:Cvel_28074.t1-p1 / transcript=Cvel_28074.t1 / gene=Cvel_28074 / organism=Chromera_velia_CCMP2878 / gene_product=hypothetical protein / transcript_product=hypothetical protein / location=Cvel_scaffold3609:1267-2361(-) / protein_length=365 / sequence_SO=supercontig / SO=protein_coding / is_pseudo=false
MTRLRSRLRLLSLLVGLTLLSCERAVCEPSHALRSSMSEASTSTASDAVSAAASQTESDPLPSWNEGDAKKSLLEFISAVTSANSTDFVDPSERIAVFDNDGTLWVEKPFYTQALFAVDRVKSLVPEHPEWNETEPFKSVLENGTHGLVAGGIAGIFSVVGATHTNMTDEEFAGTVSDWLAASRHPSLQRPYTECVYQPQLELLSLLKEKGFKVFIVSGGGVDFMRVWTNEVYGIPPERVVGSTFKTEFREGPNGTFVLYRLPELEFLNDKAGKPVGIHRHIGRRPILSFGNSDGDLQMAQYTTAGEGRRLALFVHHTDAEREFAYDRQSPVGKFDKALDMAESQGWVLVDMKRDWNRVWPASSS